LTPDWLWSGVIQLTRDFIEMSEMFEIGILALQGDFGLHAQSVRRLKVEPLLVKTVQELDQVKRLIIPGGETTTMNKLIDLYNLRQPLLDFGRSKPVLGTCAGLIMLSKKSGDPRVLPLGLIDIDVSRNAYGRQIYSFAKEGQINLNGQPENIRMVFIRAPKIRRLGENVQVLATLDGEAVMARQNHILVTAFHPELTENTSIHSHFLDF
jgi:5'-phosphate synthase pdxT subunit